MVDAQQLSQSVVLMGEAVARHVGVRQRVLFVSRRAQTAGSCNVTW